MSENFKVSEEFKEFMISLKTWIDSDFQQNISLDSEGQGFQKDDSLCFQISNWGQSDKVLLKIESDLRYLLRKEFGLNSYPFNKRSKGGRSDEYSDEVDYSTHYSNKKRLAWINKTVASFEEGNDE